MSVYVDAMRATPPKKDWPYKRACHLFADTPAELHEMAGMIGLSRSWFQSRRDFSHYDLTGWKRQQAIARGAVEVDSHFAIDFVRARRKVCRAGCGE